MSKDEKILDMEVALREAQHEFDKAWKECLHNNGKTPERENVFYAKYLVEKKGYRKASEIFDEIEKSIADLEYRANTQRKTVKVEELKAQCDWILHEVIPKTLAELEKKYTEDTK